MTNWRRDILLIPLVVGLVAAAFTYFLPKWWEKGKRINYAILQPIRHTTPSGVSFLVERAILTNVFESRVRIRNSGSQPVTSVPVLLSFGSEDPSFRVLRTAHQTSPSKEFGEITEEATPEGDRRFTFKLLNPGDQDLISVLTTGAAKLSVFSKSEGLRFEEEVIEPDADKTLSKWTLTLSSFVAALVAMLLRDIGPFLKVLMVSMLPQRKQRSAKDFKEAIRSAFEKGSQT